jgi:hypothetical protein
MPEFGLLAKRSFGAALKMKVGCSILMLKLWDKPRCVQKEFFFGQFFDFP